MMVARYWHIRNMASPGTLVHPEHWEHCFDTPQVSRLCELTKDYALHTDTVLSGNALYNRIDHVLADARQIRLWTTTACYPRKYRQTPRDPSTERPLIKLWPKMPMKSRLPGGLPAMLAQLVATVLRRRLLLGYVASWWSRSHNLGPFHESSRQGAYSTASLLYSSWGASSPTDLAALPLLLYQTKTSSGADWKASAPWFAHFNTAGWCETLLYVRVQQPVDPTPSNRASDPGDIRRHDLLWRQWRSSVTAALCVTNNANQSGDLERRNSLFQSYSEKTSLKYSLRAKLEIAEQQCSTPGTVAAV